jgi:hypothetical protein
VLLQISGGVSELESVGVGLMVMVNVLDGPGQSVDPKLNVGVTVMVADIGAVPGFRATNDRLPVPFAPNPIAVLLLVHAYDVVPTVLFVVNVTAALAPLQNVWLAGWFTWPVGLTVIVNVLAGPGQFVPPLLYVGVTTMVPVIGAVPGLVPVNEIFPVPIAGSPMAVLLFVHA